MHLVARVDRRAVEGVPCEDCRGPAELQRRRVARVRRHREAAAARRELVRVEGARREVAQRRRHDALDLVLDLRARPTLARERRRRAPRVREENGE